MYKNVEEFFAFSRKFYNSDQRSCLPQDNQAGARKLIEATVDSNLKFHQSMKLLNQMIETLAGDDFSMLNTNGTPVPFPNHVLMVGCGGIGSWFLPKFVKLVNDARRKNLIGKESLKTLTICDGDDIEASNLIRQNFGTRDVGKGKAEVLFRRYSSELNEGTHFGFIDKYILSATTLANKPKEQKDKFVSIEGYITSLNIPQNAAESILIINLIDNNESRKDLHAYANMGQQYGLPLNLMYIDVANSVYSGQLTLSIPKVLNSNGVQAGDYSMNITNVLRKYYDILPENSHLNDKISVFDCSVRDANVVEQLFDVNNLAATVLCSYINTWIEKGKIFNSEIYFSTGSNMYIKPVSKIRSLFVDGYSNFGLASSWGDLEHYSSLKQDINIIGPGGVNLKDSKLSQWVNNKSKPQNRKLFRHLLNMGLMSETTGNRNYNLYNSSLHDFSKSNPFCARSGILSKAESDKMVTELYESTFKNRQLAESLNTTILQNII